MCNATDTSMTADTATSMSNTIATSIGLVAMYHMFSHHRVGCSVPGGLASDNHVNVPLRENMITM